MMLCIFYVFICHPYFFFSEIALEIVCLFFNWVISFFTYFEYKSFVRAMISKYFLPGCVYISTVFCRAEVFNSDEGHFLINRVLSQIMFLISEHSLLNPKSQILSLVASRSL